MSRQVYICLAPAKMADLARDLKRIIESEKSIINVVIVENRQNFTLFLLLITDILIRT